MTDLSHPHNGAWYACCLETLFSQVLAGMGLPERPAMNYNLATHVREYYALPRMNPIEFNADLPPEVRTPKPDVPRRQRIRILGGKRPCATCGRMKICSYLAPGGKGRKFQPNAPRECSGCYHARHPDRDEYLHAR